MGRTVFQQAGTLSSAQRARSHVLRKCGSWEVWRVWSRRRQACGPRAFPSPVKLRPEHRVCARHWVLGAAAACGGDRTQNFPLSGGSTEHLL